MRTPLSLSLAAFSDKHGPKELQRALTGGQHSHSNGIFYGGNAPTWSNRILRSIIEEHLSGVKHVALLDFRTGLGPYGYGELILNGDFTGSFSRAR